jgi:hypothetical protein
MRPGEAGLKDHLGDQEGDSCVLADGLDEDLGGAHRVALALAGVLRDAAHACASNSSTAYWSPSKIHASTMWPSRTV